MSLAAALFLAGLTGFISLSYEILWFRAISFVSGSSPAARAVSVNLRQNASASAKVTL